VDEAERGESPALQKSYAQQHTHKKNPVVSDNIEEKSRSPASPVIESYKEPLSPCGDNSVEVVDRVSEVVESP
ncbi:hypothetical protein A2U01_0087164, partial [Trifolium medium]|nr:hypothetical protein [Trifolium medium]